MNSSAKRLVLSALFLFGASCSGYCGKSGAATEAGLSAGAPGLAATAAAPLPGVNVKDLGTLADLVAASAKSIRRTDFDPAAIVTAKGQDPKVLFEWVRDNTWWVPYRGALRGAEGVLLDRVGNSVDRSILLGDLLRRAGHSVRMTHASLTEEQARQLLKTLRPVPDRRGDASPAPTPSPEYLKAIEAIIPGFGAAMKARTDAARLQEAGASTLFRTQSDQLMTALRDVAPKADAKTDAAVLDALRDHWWIEREEKGAWIAMDTMVADAQPGHAVAASTDTITWGKDESLPSLPPSQWQAVQIRVVIERYQGGATTEATVLETTLRPLDVLEKPIALFHMPKPWPSRLERTATALPEAASLVTEWVPALRIGRETTVQSGFTSAGEVKSSPLDPVSSGGGAGMFDAFGGAMGGDDGGAVTAEWIDYEILIPGSPRQRIRRPVFDVLGPARRAAKDAAFDATTEAVKLERAAALLGRTNILLQPCEFTDAFAAWAVSSTIVSHQEDFRKLSAEQDPTKARALAANIVGDAEVWSPLLELALLRPRLTAPAHDSFIDRPNILNHRSTPVLVGKDLPRQEELIDIAANGTGVRAGSARDPFSARLQQGVADTVAEILTLGSDLKTAANTAALFASTSGGSARTLIRPGDVANARAMGWPGDVKARLVQQVEDGFLIVALSRPTSLDGRDRLGWWRVDPQTGATIGVMDTGFNQGMPEQSKVRSAIKTMQQWLTENEITSMPAGSTVQDAIYLQDKRELVMYLIREATRLGLY